MGKPGTYFKFIEAELFAYDQTKRELAELEADIIEAAPLKEAAGGHSGISDPTARKAGKLITSPEITALSKRIQYIESALLILGEGHREVFDLRYRKGMKWQMVQMEMNVSQSVYFDLRRELVRSVAAKYGYRV
jgi:RinA family phage transcriptional activator